MSDLAVDILDLPQQAGSFKDLSLTVPAPAGLGTEMIAARVGSPLRLEVSLTTTEDGVLVRGRAQVELAGQCVRCLRDLAEERTVTFDELYLTEQAAARQAAEGDEEAEDLFRLGETTLDVEPALRDALVLDLPFQPLCRLDCRGLCPECGERLDDLPADHHHEQRDPRWSVLASLLPAQDDQDSEDGQAGQAGAAASQAGQAPEQEAQA